MKVRKTRKSTHSSAHDDDDDDIYAEVDENQAMTTGIESADSRLSDEHFVEPQSRDGKQANSNAGDRSSEVDYAKALPKHERQQQQRSASVLVEPIVTQTRAADDSDYDYVTLRETAKRQNAALFANKSMLEFPSVAPLAHARVEYTERSHFDDIRLFLSRNRKHNEVFREVPGKNLGGSAINQLTEFLADLGQNKTPSSPTTSTTTSSSLTAAAASCISETTEVTRL